MYAVNSLGLDCAAALHSWPPYVPAMKVKSGASAANEEDSVGADAETPDDLAGAGSLGNDKSPSPAKLVFSARRLRTSSNEAPLEDAAPTAIRARPIADVAAFWSSELLVNGVAPGTGSQASSMPGRVSSMLRKAVASTAMNLSANAAGSSTIRTCRVPSGCLARKASIRLATSMYSDSEKSNLLITAPPGAPRSEDPRRHQMPAHRADNGVAA